MTQKIRIKIKGYDARIVDAAAEQIIENATRTGAKTAGPVPLPTRIKRHAVLRSPHIDARSKEHYEIRIHMRLIEVLEPTSKTIDALTHLQLPAGVGVEIK